MKYICVYCGSRSGNLPDYAEVARHLGTELARAGFSLVYGGSEVGLMGIIANAALQNGAEVVGVIPKQFSAEIVHEAVTELYLVDTMHQRKQKMIDCADAFVALPGGIGTLEEIFEAIAWAHLGYHQKPCAFLNVSGYYNSLADFLDQAVANGFISAARRQMIYFAASSADLLDWLKDQTQASKAETKD